ncbi:CRISPR-associated helicase Cas3' [Kitasatospora sp. NPDC002040]|uniref:CRISPR-associated helicase Cas3' n=1 Tax=Kitasatospora sp. NPDC002040 TaxID=3154661 RepID=UPI003334600A
MSFKGWFGFDPNSLQGSLLRGLPECAVPGEPGLLVIMSETGSGKTEAGLWSARWLGGPGVGVHLALPTMATTDAAYRRVDEWAGRALALSSPVTLAHSQALDRQVSRVLAASGGGVETAPPVWLAGRGRAVLAGVSVSTIDQVLTAVLRVRHNVLRLGGLTRKVLVVDECHAYDPYMQTLLRRALAWWGALGIPVVLMSATVPAAVACSLAAAYLSGAAPGVPVPQMQPRYPGWLYVDGRTGDPTVSELVETDRPRVLDIAMVDLPGSNRSAERDGMPAADANRAGFVKQLLDGRSGDFCVLMVCNTVASAQNTARALDEMLGADVEVFLLHARYRVKDRRKLTARVEGAFGKDRRKRPGRALLVTTQVCEQSLDLSLDHVVTDLAPVAQVVQRAGRGLRHTVGDDVRVPVSVLVPLDAKGRPDDGRWEWVYGRALMRSSRELLAGHGTVAVPGDVQKLVDAVCQGWDTDTDDRDVRRHLAGERVMANAALPVMIPHPRDLVDLFDLTDLSMTDAEAATRYNLDTVTLLPLWEREDGSLSLEPEEDVLLPDVHADVRPLRERLLSVRRQPWQRELPSLGKARPGWAKERRLGEVLLLVHPFGAREVELGEWAVTYDCELGLVAQSPVSKEQE